MSKRRNFPYFRALFTLVALALVSANIFYLFIHVMSKRLHQDEVILEPGTQFKAFKIKLLGITDVGYLTNHDMSPEHNNGDLLQAQYILAPIVVHLNDSTYKYNILDFSNPNFLVYKLKDINAVPIYDNQYRKVLAEKRP